MTKTPTSSKELKSFEEDVMHLVRYIEETWDGTQDIKPTGYDAMMKDYSDWDGVDDLDEISACSNFDGYNDVTGMYFPFPIRVSLPHVAYEVRNQVDSPLFVLLAACVTYGCIRGQISGKERIEKDLPFKDLMETLEVLETYEEKQIEIAKKELELQKTEDIKTLYLDYYNTGLDDDVFVKDFYYQVGEILDRKELKKNEEKV